MDIERVTNENFERIHRAALILSGNPWDADDLAQETFLILSRQADGFEGRSSIYTWLYGILLNLDRRERRRQAMKRRKWQVLGERQDVQPESAPPAAAAAEVADWKASLWSRVAELPDGQRQALVLRFSEGLAYDEIARAMDCPLGTVKSRIFHGLAALRRLLAKDEEVRITPDFPDEDQHRAFPS